MDCTFVAKNCMARCIQKQCTMYKKKIEYLNKNNTEVCKCVLDAAYATTRKVK